MSDHVYKMLELTGSSTAGIEEAVERAIAKASETVRNIQWFEVVETRGHVQRRQGRALAGDAEGRVYARRVSARPKPSCIGSGCAGGGYGSVNGTSLNNVVTVCG